MPYMAPSFAGIINDALVIHRDGRVEIDGEQRGWISNIEIVPTGSPTSRSSRRTSTGPRSYPGRRN